MTARGRRALAIAGSCVFLVVVPGTVVGLIPWWITRWQAHPAISHLWPVRALGAVLALGGTLFLFDAARRFAVEGLGTPAPIAPTKHLVISGLYRYVRNPMYLAVLAVVLGQAFYFGSVGLVGYSVLLCLCFHVFVIAYEEAALRQSFPVEYEVYTGAVPRWIPRVHAWRENTALRSGDNAT